MAEKLKILLVDPDIKKSAEIVIQLTSRGFYTSHVVSPENILAALLQQSFEVIVIAILFKGDNADLVIPELKSAFPDISIIPVVEKNTPELEKKIRAHGIAFFMSKPIQIDELEQVLNQLVEVHKKLKSKIKLTGG